VGGGVISVLDEGRDGERGGGGGLYQFFMGGGRDVERGGGGVVSVLHGGGGRDVERGGGINSPGG
jgi:hypothetical protein